MNENRRRFADGDGHISIFTYVSTNLIPVLVCRHFSMMPAPSISSIPSSAPDEFLFPGNFTGLASAAMACNEWNVEPIRSHSLVPIRGALGPRGRWRIRPPDLFTMKRWRKPIFKKITLPQATMGGCRRRLGKPVVDMGAARVFVLIARAPVFSQCNNCRDFVLNGNTPMKPFFRSLSDKPSYKPERWTKTTSSRPIDWP